MVKAGEVAVIGVAVNVLPIAALAETSTSAGAAGAAATAEAAAVTATGSSGRHSEKSTTATCEREHPNCEHDPPSLPSTRVSSLCRLGPQCRPCNSV